MSKKELEIKKMSFEQAAAELEKIVRQLESGNVDLEKSIEYYTAGIKLKNHCEEKLNQAKLSIEKIGE